MLHIRMSRDHHRGISDYPLTTGTPLCSPELRNILKNEAPMRTSSHTNFHAVPPEIVLEFLAHTLPFNELDADTLSNLATSCLIDFFPKGTIIFRQDQTQVQHFYLIQKGGVKIYLKDE